VVDFKKLREAKAAVAPTVPREIFNQLPRPEGINDLYVSQDQALQQWYARRGDKDVVLKLHTGGGKSLVGLLIAQSVMNEKKEPVLYLAPTVQLVNQIVEKGSEYGISALPYVKGQELADAFLAAEAVLVGTYETVFAGKSKFDRRWRVRASRNAAQ
jgi:replicative superfamily II helicase